MKEEISSNMQIHLLPNITKPTYANQKQKYLLIISDKKDEGHMHNCVMK